MNEEMPATTIAAWRVATIWAVLSVVGVLLAMPFLLTLIQDLPAQNQPPMPVLILAMVLQTCIMSFVLAWLGTAAGRVLRVGSPLFEAWLTKRKVIVGKTFVGAALLGALGGVLVIALDAVFAGYMPTPLRTIPQPTPLQGLLAGFYGGISEEVLMRLGAATLSAWVLGKIVGFEKHRALVLGFGIVFGAILFGVAHLPIASTIWPINGVVVARILLLNAVVGLLAGVVYVRRGLEHAVVLHFAADIVLYVIRPLVQG